MVNSMFLWLDRTRAIVMVEKIKIYILACFYFNFLNGLHQHNAFHFLRMGKRILLLGFLVWLSASSVYAQNTKGDRAEVGGSAPKREHRFNPFKKKQKKGQPSYNRAQSKGVTRAGSARPVTKEPKAAKLYPQKGRFVNNPSRTPAKKNPATPPYRRVTVRSNTGRTRNVYPQSGRYVNNPSKTPKQRQPTYSNKSTVTRLKKLQSGPQGSPPSRTKVVPRSASGSFIARKSINVYANFPRPKKKGEQAYTRDIAGRKLRTKNFETPRPEIITPTFKPYQFRKRVGDRPYSGPAAGSYRSATRTRQQAWTGDIAGRKIRGKNFSSKKNVEGQPILAKRRGRDRFGDQSYRGIIPGGGAKSRSGSKGAGTPIPAKTPGIGAEGIGKFKGRIKAGKYFSNQGEQFTGTIKTRRPQKGGGSVSGRLWNNQGRALAPKGYTNRGVDYAGNIKSRRPDKGGGSISGRIENKPLPPKGYASQGERYAGNLKARRPQKGGGSVSGQLWNNRETPVGARPPSDQTMRASLFSGNVRRRAGFGDQGEEYPGNIKTARRKEPKKDEPILVRTPRAASAKRVGGYPGKMRRFENQPGFADQGEEFTGFIKVDRKKESKKEEPIPVKTPPASAKRIGGYPGKMKLFENQPGFADQGEEYTGDIRRPRLWKDYIKNPNASEESIKKKRPTSTTYAVDGLHVAVKTRKYVKQDKSAEEALRKLAPTETTKATGGLQVRVKQYNYIKNPSSAEEALRVREPGKAFARATDYQGNIKMQKFKLFEKNKGLHPDAQFVKTNKNNVPSERDVATNFKLWWARLFKKQETQPDHLKEKGKKPRYDKGEEGMWYE